MNIYDVAKSAGVSTATVSRYLNRSGYVGKNTAARIQQAIDASGYRISALAQKLSKGDSLKLIGLVCYDIEDLYYAKCASVLEKRLSAAGYEIILSNTGKSVDKGHAVVDSLLRKKVDALIFIGSVFMDGTGSLLSEAAKSTPCFLINARFDRDNVYSAYCDDEKATAEAARRMLESGRERVFYVRGADTYGARTKIRGFLQAVPDPARVLCCGETFDEVEKGFAALYQTHRPDGILCSDDGIAAGILKGAQALGISVPQELALVGHNDSLLSRTSTPALSSIDNRVETLSQITADNIVALFHGDPIRKCVEAEFRLVRRQTF